MRKRQNIYKGFLDFQSEFSHKFACWANNHRGWAKMKKFNKRIAKKREKRDLKRRIDYESKEDKVKRNE